MRRAAPTTAMALSLVVLAAPEAGAEATGPARMHLHPLLRQYAAELWQGQREADRQAYLSALLAALQPFVAGHEHDFAARARGSADRDSPHAGSGCWRGPARGGCDHREPATLSLCRGHWRLGIALWTQQLAGRRQLGDRRGEGATLNNLGELARSLGRTEEAAAYCEQALGILHEIGAVDTEQVVQDNLDALKEELASASARPPIDQPAATALLVPEDPQPTPAAMPTKRRWWQFGERRGGK